MAVVQYSNVYRSGASSGSPVTSIYVCDDFPDVPAATIGDIAFVKSVGITYLGFVNGWIPIVVQDMRFLITGDIAIQKITPTLRLIDNQPAANQRAWNIVDYQGNLYVQPTDDGGGATVSAIQALRNGDVTIGKNLAAVGFFERARGTYIGQTQIFGLSSGNVWASSGTVALSSPSNYSFWSIGDRVYVNLFLTITLQGIGPTEIYVHTPNGAYTSTGNYEAGVITIYDSIGGHGPGRSFMVGGRNYITFYKTPISAINGTLTEISGQLSWPFSGA